MLPQPSGPSDQTDLERDAPDHLGYVCDVPGQTRGQTSQQGAGRPRVGPAGLALAPFWLVFCTILACLTNSPKLVELISVKLNLYI